MDKLAKGDINQNNTPENATSPNDTLDLSDSTIQAFQDALQFKPLSQLRSTDDVPQFKHNEQIKKSSDQHIENNCTETSKNNNYEENGTTNNNMINGGAIFQGISLKDFEKHHKLMKEANLEKRRLLSNAIEQRYG